MPVRCVHGAGDAPRASAVIASLDGDRGGNVPRLIEQLRQQSFTDLEIVLCVGEAPNGRSRNLGAEAARGEYLIFIDDDAILGDEELIARMLEPFVADRDMGLIGVSQALPTDSNWFQRWSATQIPRVTSPVVDELTESDMVTTLCLAVPRQLFEELGGMNGRLLAGVDPELRHRVRRAGRRVVVIPNSWAYHPVPETLVCMVKYAFRKGGLTAWQYRFARDLMYDCPENHVADEPGQTMLIYRVARKFARITKELLTLRPVGVIYDLSYTAGYVHGLIRRWPCAS